MAKVDISKEKPSLRQPCLLSVIYNIFPSTKQLAANRRLLVIGLGEKGARDVIRVERGLDFTSAVPGMLIN